MIIMLWLNKTHFDTIFSDQIYITVQYYLDIFFLNSRMNIDISKKYLLSSESDEPQHFISLSNGDKYHSNTFLFLH
jgi:hypothetical protein